jgi:predicted nucleotidyltransferase
MLSLAQIAADRFAARERARSKVRTELRAVLERHLARGTRVWVYGSLAHPGRFHEFSDIDLALEDPTRSVDLAQLQNAISEGTRLEADVMRLEDSRLAPRIRREGEAWTV